LASGVERRGRRGRADPGDATSRVTTKRKKIIDVVDKMVKINKCCG